MYVISKDGAIGPVEEITYAHEYTHALQDQAFDLRKVIGAGHRPERPLDGPRWRWSRATPRSS